MIDRTIDQLNRVDRSFNHLFLAFEFDSSCRALWGALQLESNSNASFRRRFEFKIFKRPKNREDGSKFDDFWTKSIASARTKIWKIFERTSERTNERIVQNFFEIFSIVSAGPTNTHEAWTWIIVLDYYEMKNRHCWRQHLYLGNPTGHKSCS